MDPIYKYLSEVQKTVDQIDQGPIETVVKVLHEARLNYQNVYILGNGGSAATAAHFVCDLAKSTRVSGCPDLRVIGLADNMAIFSAYANDEGYENVFAMQLKNLIRPEDIVLAISTSGNSPNVVQAVELANQFGATTIGFTGRSGGQLGSIVQIEVRVPNEFADQIEDVHMILAHLVSRRLCELARPSILMTQAQQREPHSYMPSLVSARGNVADESEELSDGVLPGRLDPVDLANFDLGSLLLTLLGNFRATSGSFLLLSKNGEVIDSAVAYTGQVRRADGKRFTQFLSRGLAGWVARHQIVTLVMNTSWDKRWLFMEGEESAKPRTVLCAPVLNRNRTAGVITLSRPDAMPFTADEMFALNNFSTEVCHSLVPSIRPEAAPD